MKKRFTAVLLIAATLATLLASAAFAEDGEPGFRFSDNDTYRLSAPLADTPNTFEATVYFPPSMKTVTRGGIIYGDNTGSGRSIIQFEVMSNGQPRLYWVDSEKRGYTWLFNEVDVYLGRWVHLAIVRDGEANEVRCYVDGELMQTLPEVPEPAEGEEPAPDSADILPTVAGVIGGDNRTGNGFPFRGRIKDIAIYSDVRTADEIRSDMTSPGSHGLLLHYDLSEAVWGETVKDLGPYSNDALYSRIWLERKAPLEEYAYSFAVIGDTQKVSWNASYKMDYIYDWILENAEAKNTKFVIGLGDITDRSAEREWETAARNIHRLDGNIAYSIVRGNHDTVETYTQAFPYSDYEGTVGGSYDGTMLNTWQELVIGEVKYLILSLDYGASDGVLAWAGQLVAERPGHNVIVTTHAYMDGDAELITPETYYYPPSLTGGYNDGDDIWNKLVKLYPNIVLVLCGHVHSAAIVVRQDEGIHGNTVTQMLIDPQGVDDAYNYVGMVAMFHFSEDGSKLQIEYYSTARGEYLLEENQRTVEIDMLSTRSASAAGALGDGSDVNEKGGNGGYIAAIVILSALLGLSVTALTVLAVKKKK